jgi:hypothetical protein
VLFDLLHIARLIYLIINDDASVSYPYFYQSLYMHVFDAKNTPLLDHPFCVSYVAHIGEAIQCKVVGRSERYYILFPSS